MDCSNLFLCLAVCLETVGVFLLTFTKNISLEAHPGVPVDFNPGISMLFRKLLCSPDGSVGPIVLENQR